MLARPALVALALALACAACAALERCEFRLKGQPIAADRETPSDCDSLDDGQREAWEKENKSFDDFHAKIEDVEVHVTVVNGSVVADTGERKMAEEKLTINYEFRTVLYGHLNIYNKMEACQQMDDIFRHCACAVGVREQMIGCLDDLDACFPPPG